VLLAVLAAAGLLALAPALVRRYDATERLTAERALSTARVLDRKRRARTVPGRRPVKPPSWMAPPPLRMVAATERAAPRKPKPGPSIYRRRRVLAALVLLNVVQLLGVALVGPGFWISLSVTFAMLVLYLRYLRGQALLMARRRRAEARQTAWLLEQQAQVRLAQERRAAARREAARLLEEELQRAAVSLTPVPTISYRPQAGRVRGRAYEAGPRVARAS
jgi:hypothetical protein